MKKRMIITFCLLSKLISYSQSTITVSLNEKHDSTYYSIENRRSRFILNFVDSLNSYSQGILPFFVSNCDFDYENSNYWDGNHQANSLRKMIFDKVNNEKVLKVIINSKNKNYKNTSKLMIDYLTPYKIPYQDESNWTFAKERLKKLRNKNVAPKSSK